MVPRFHPIYEKASAKSYPQILALGIVLEKRTTENHYSKYFSRTV
jgi:hypothetical protein